MYKKKNNQTLYTTLLFFKKCQSFYTMYFNKQKKSYTIKKGIVSFK